MTTLFNPVTVDQLLNVPVQKVWNAITQHDQMTQWFFDNIPEFEPEVGFQTRFPVHSGERVFTHLWKLLEVVPLKKIVYQWSYLEYPGNSRVVFELKELGPQTKLLVNHEILEPFPQDIREFTSESCRTGWEYFIQGRLRLFLEG